MDAQELKTLQSPLKRQYRTDAEQALVTLTATGTIDDVDIACKVDTGRAVVTAGLHPAIGGSGLEICAGDMLLEALAACAGVTFKAVATSLDIPLRSATVTVQGVLDFRGTMGVAKDAGVGFQKISLHFNVDSDAPKETLNTLLKLTERYCVVFQTLNMRPNLEVWLLRPPK